MGFRQAYRRADEDLQLRADEALHRRTNERLRVNVNEAEQRPAESAPLEAADEPLTIDWNRYVESRMKTFHDRW